MKIRIRRLNPKPTEIITLRPMQLRVHTRAQRVLDFDIENRPLSYLGSDFTTGEVTAISWAWADDPINVSVCLLGEWELPDILRRFVSVYNQADIVTGHYVRGHDLPFINGALMELGMPGLSDKRVQDTKLDLMRTKGISLSQESISSMARIEEGKVHMTQTGWRRANRLTPEGLDLVRARVVGDVQQHLSMREWLRTHGYLGAPRMWKSYSNEPLASYSA